MTTSAWSLAFVLALALVPSPSAADCGSATTCGACLPSCAWTAGLTCTPPVCVAASPLPKETRYAVVGPSSASCANNSLLPNASSSYYCEITSPNFADPDFELNQQWRIDSSSANIKNFICDKRCSTKDMSARIFHGSWVAWFGGTNFSLVTDKYVLGSISAQTVVPASATHLSFYMLLESDTWDPKTYFEVSVKTGYDAAATTRTAYPLVMSSTARPVTKEWVPVEVDIGGCFTAGQSAEFAFTFFEMPRTSSVFIDYINLISTPRRGTWVNRARFTSAASGCAPGCLPGAQYDQWCDTACNTAACGWDSGACAGATTTTTCYSSSIAAQSVQLQACYGDARALSCCIDPATRQWATDRVNSILQQSSGCNMPPYCESVIRGLACGVCSDGSALTIKNGVLHICPSYVEVAWSVCKNLYVRANATGACTPVPSKDSFMSQFGIVASSDVNCFSMPAPGSSDDELPDPHDSNRNLVIGVAAGVGGGGALLIVIVVAIVVVCIAQRRTPHPTEAPATMGMPGSADILVMDPGSVFMVPPGDVLLTDVAGNVITGTDNNTTATAVPPPPSGSGMGMVDMSAMPVDMSGVPVDMSGTPIGTPMMHMGGIQMQQMQGMQGMIPVGVMSPVMPQTGMGQMGQMGQMNQMGQMGQMNQMGQMGQMNQMGQQMGPVGIGSPLYVPPPQSTESMGPPS
eukprot:m51a1_g1977 hypothetical protein (690) ;mRNA; f:1114942-1117194